MKTTATRLRVTPIPGEPDRYFVASSSRDLDHVVDMAYSESPKDKPKAVCGCEAVMARGNKTCPHIEAVEQFKNEQALQSKEA